MTRTVKFRVVLAWLMLPNFTAYWWLLPRRWKRCRTAMDALVGMATARILGRAFERYDRMTGITAAMMGVSSTPRICAREFRLPFRITVWKADQ